MQMLKKSLMRSPRPWRLATRSALLSMLILGACATQPTPSPAPTNPDPAKAPLSCAEFAPLTFSEGKPEATAADVEDALRRVASNPADPLAWVRGVVGDTVQTRGEIAGYSARRKALGCQP